MQDNQPLVLIVSPSQMLKYIRFFKEYGVCGNNKESTNQQHRLFFSMIKFSEQRDYYLSLMRMAHWFFVRVEVNHSTKM